MNILIDTKTETLEDLSRNGYQFIQKKSGYRFGEDTVLLADFISRHIKGLPREAKCLDLGSHCGASTFLLHARCPEYKITSIEIQKAPFDMLKRNIEMNRVAEKITPINADIRDLKAQQIIPGSQYDLVYSNPPYFSPDHGILSDKADSEEINSARFEMNGTISDFIGAATYALRPGGIFAMVYRVSRLAEVFAIMKESRIEPAWIRFVHPRTGKTARHVLIGGRKGSNTGDLKVLAPLLLRNDNGELSDEYLIIYGEKEE